MTTAAPPLATLAASPLAAAGGWTVARVLGPRALAAMAAEAASCHAGSATEAVLRSPRRGPAARHPAATRVRAGPAALRAFYAAPRCPPGCAA